MIRTTLISAAAAITLLGSTAFAFAGDDQMKSDDTMGAMGASGSTDNGGAMGSSGSMKSDDTMGSSGSMKSDSPQDQGSMTPDKGKM